jgi:hypothetical protein
MSILSGWLNDGLRVFQMSVDVGRVYRWICIEGEKRISSENRSVLTVLRSLFEKQVLLPCFSPRSSCAGCADTVFQGRQ